MTFGLVRIRIVEDLKEAQAKQNAQINLLLAENERSRIGQDLHDSLGHTFAMLSVKTDLALQLFQMEAYPQVEKELKEIHQISKDSMNEVRTIVENLKSRTLASELETVKKMLEIAGIEVQVDNQLDKASLTHAKPAYGVRGTQGVLSRARGSHDDPSQGVLSRARGSHDDPSQSLDRARSRCFEWSCPRFVQSRNCRQALPLKRHRP